MVHIESIASWEQRRRKIKRTGNIRRCPKGEQPYLVQSVVLNEGRGEIPKEDDHEWQHGAAAHGAYHADDDQDDVALAGEAELKQKKQWI